jgi:hypothetical protein
MSKRLRAAIRASNRGRALRPKGPQGRPSSPSLDFDDANSGELLASEPGVALTAQDDAFEDDSAKALALSPVTREPASPAALSAPVAAAAVAPPEVVPAPVTPTPAMLFELPPEPSSPAETLRDIHGSAPPGGNAPVEAASEPPPMIDAGPKSAPQLTESRRLAAVTAPTPPAASPLEAITQPVLAARPAHSEAAPVGEMAAAYASITTNTTKPSLERITPAKPAKAESAEAPSSTQKPVKGPESARVEGPKSGSKSLTDDELDGSSVSAEFFQKDTGVTQPAIELHHELEEVSQAPVLSPKALARRARFRRLVAGVVAFAGVISLAVVGKTLAASTKSPAPAARPAAPIVVTQETKQEVAPAMDTRLVAKAPEGPEKAVPEAAKVEDTKGAAGAAEAAKVEETKGAAEAAKVEAQAEAKPEEAKAEAPKVEGPAVDASALKKEALKLLDRGKMKDAIEKAKEAIAADPADAISYLYLGSALQETGKWKDGVEAYCECVRHATKGPINECRQMGGHK